MKSRYESQSLILLKSTTTVKVSFILTNGNVTQQKNKISLLNIPFKKEIKVYYSSSMGEEFEKPNPFFLLKILNDNNFCKEQVIYIGDSENR